MPKQIVPRTAVTPNGGIYRIDRRNIPQVEDLGVVDGKQHWEVKEAFTYDLGNGVKVKLLPPQLPLVDHPLDSERQKAFARNQTDLQFMWDSMPLEMKQDIIARYHPHNCVKKEH